MPKQALQPIRKKSVDEEINNDYRLTKVDSSCWIEVDDLLVWVRRGPKGGVIVDITDGQDPNDILASCHARG